MTSAPTRHRLPNRRPHLVLEFEHGGFAYRAGVGYFDAACQQPAEIFLKNGKVGSDTDAAGRDSAVVASIAMQYGVPVETIRKALLRDAAGRPSSPLGAALDRLQEQTNKVDAS